MLSNEQIDVFYQNVGDLIKSSRKLKDINQQTLANYLGISRVSLVNIENGKQRAPLHVILEISNFLKVPLKELYPALVVEDDTIDPSILSKINKEIGVNPGSADKAIDFIKSFINKDN